MARAAKRVASKKSPRRKTAAKKSIGRKKVAAKGTEIPVKTVSAEPAAAGKSLAPLEDIEKLFEDFLQRRWFHMPRLQWPDWGEMSGLLDQKAPSVDIVDRPKEVVVRVEIPGVEKEDLDVSIVDRTLTIKGSSRKEEEEEGDDYFRHEIRSGSFSRSMLLPADVNTAKAKATFKGGVVQLHLPKVRASKRRQIAVD